MAKENQKLVQNGARITKRTVRTHRWRSQRIKHSIHVRIVSKKQNRIQKITQNQIKALRKLHKLKEHDKLTPQVGKAAVCFECKSFKGFICEIYLGCSCSSSAETSLPWRLHSRSLYLPCPTPIWKMLVVCMKW